MNENLNPELPVNNLSEEANGESTKEENVDIESANVEESAVTIEVADVEAVNEVPSDVEENNAIIEEAEIETSAENLADVEDTGVNTEESESAEPETIPEPSSKNTSSLTKDEIIEKLKNLSSQQGVPSRSEVESLKQAFYKLRSADIDAQKAGFIEAGNEAEAFTPTPDPSEDVLKTFLSDIKEKRANLVAEEERQKEDNYNKKLQIIDSIKNLTESSDDFNKLYKEFKDLQ
ncbi:MAG: DUF349 domain-containing protein, partial [Prevotella sp.]|nr:DUF349 domain-containing protein [Prevotella sp.]